MSNESFIWVRYRETYRDTDGRHQTRERAKQVPAKLQNKLATMGYTLISEAEAHRINGTVTPAAPVEQKKTVEDAPVDKGLGHDDGKTSKATKK